MTCLIKGCNFVLRNIPHEAFAYQKDSDPEFRFQTNHPDIFPYLLVNIGSGVSIVKVRWAPRTTRDGRAGSTRAASAGAAVGRRPSLGLQDGAPPPCRVRGVPRTGGRWPAPLGSSPALPPQVETEDRFEWVGGSSIGGGTFWGLGALLTKTKVSRRPREDAPGSASSPASHAFSGEGRRPGDPRRPVSLWKRLLPRPGPGRVPGPCGRQPGRPESPPPCFPPPGWVAVEPCPPHPHPGPPPAPRRGAGSWAVGTPPAPAPHPLPSALSPQKFDELLHLASKGQHTSVDMLVQDVYGGAHQTLGLSGDLIASSFGKSAAADKGAPPPPPPSPSPRACGPLAGPASPSGALPLPSQSSPRRTWPRACCT